MEKFLKSIGAADAKLDDNWLTASWGELNNRLDLLDRIHFPKNKRPTGVHEGDNLVLYAAGWERIFGIAVVTSDEPYELMGNTRLHKIYSLPVHKPAFHRSAYGRRPPQLITKGQERWPWVLDVEVPLVVPRLSLAPTLAEIQVANTSVRQQSHISLSDEKYALAVAALTRRVQP